MRPRLLSRPAVRHSGHLFVLLFGLLAAAPAMGQETMLGPVDGLDLPATDVDRIAVGDTAPDFTLQRHGGGTVTLSEYRGKKNVVLVFYRGHWCPFCVKQLTELSTLLDGEMDADTELLVLSVEGEMETRQTIGRITKGAGAAPAFTFVSDPESAVIGRYGVLNPSGSRRGIPHPAAYVIDKSGLVRWRDVQTDYKIRPTNEQLHMALEEVEAG